MIVINLFFPLLFSQAAYCAWMNGVDVADQFRSYFDIRIIGRAWYMNYYYWVLDTSVCNSYLIFVKYHKGKHKNSDASLGNMTMKEYRKRLCWELVHCFKYLDFAPGTRGHRRRLPEGPPRQRERGKY